MIQDALYDAEEYLRSELAEQTRQERSRGHRLGRRQLRRAGRSGRDLSRHRSDGEPRLARAAAAAKRKSAIGRFFGVIADPRTYGALFYMLLSLATGIVYFTCRGDRRSACRLGLMILIIGIPLLVLFLGLIRVLSLVEGRIVEVMLGERMPRRPLYTQRGKGWLERIKEMFTDRPHLDGDAVLPADAAAGHRVLHGGGDLAERVVGLHRAPLAVVVPASPASHYDLSD